MKFSSRKYRLGERFVACGLWSLALVPLPVTMSLGCAQDQGAPQVSEREALTDQLLPRIAALAASVKEPSVDILTHTLRVGNTAHEPPGMPPSTLVSLGDLDGDGVPEMVLSWPVPDVEGDAEAIPAPEGHALWGIYLLSWNGTNWKASRLASGVEDSTVHSVNLGPPIGEGIALITLEGDAATAYPSVFQIKDHAAALLWDSQAEESRYEALVQGRVSFESQGSAPAEMIVTGKADPGFLQFDHTGHRGFNVRAVYRWDGQAYIPQETGYSAGQDNTLYRFIAALHLHDFRSAYALTVPGQFLNTKAPTLDSFRELIQDTWPEFVADHVFRALEAPAGSPEISAFELTLPDKRYLYSATFSTEGKFLLTGLKRTAETVPVEPEPPEH